MADDTTIGVVVKTYPKLSETFILEELLGLERLGLDLQIFSLHTPTDDRANPETSDVKASVHYPDTRLASLVTDHGRLLARHPIRYVRTLVDVLRQRDPGGLRNFATAGWLAAESQRVGASHFHVHFLNEPASITEIAACLAGVAFTASGHAKDIYLTPPSALRRKLMAAKFTVTCTDHNRQHLAALAPGAVVEQVHHGVDLQRFGPSFPASPDRPDVPVILGVGRLRPKKGFDLLLDACARLRAGGREFECRIVGYGPEEATLRAQVAELGLQDHVTLLGKCTRDEVIEQYRMASMLVQPCRVTADGDRDGIPNVLLEAMAMGLPVISTPVSGIPELVIDGENGMLVEPDDSESLSRAIATVLDDAEAARSLGSTARATIEQSFTADRSARRIAALLDRPRVGYVVKGYPRLSELFIANEIYRVERLGLPLRLFVLKPSDEEISHQIVGETIAKPEYLPPLSSISKQPLGRWLRSHLGAYRPALVRVALASPVGFSRAIGLAMGQAWRSRKGRWPRKLYLKEFLFAAAIADRVLADPAISHLHAHFCHGSTTVTWLAATMSGRTFSFTAHAKDIYRADLNPAGLLGRKLRAAEFVTTCTGANHEHLAALEPDAAVSTVYHGLNEEFVRLLKAQPNLDRQDRPGQEGDRLRILSVGRLVAKKGLDLLIAATEMLVESGLDVEVRIVGEEGEQGPALRQLVSELGLDDRITFLPPMDQPGLFAEYRAADVFCLPCRVVDDGDRDGIPNVLIEAMAAGLPVLSTPVSGIPELVDHRDNGLLVSPESPAALAKAMSELHDNPDLAVRLAACARETVTSRFDGWATTQDLVDLLSEAVWS